MTTFVINKPVTIEETRFFEFKEIKGTNPVSSIKNTCDEYVVSFLNSDGGSIFWGIRDNDRTAVGVFLNYQERDELRKEVVNKISAIKPAISPNAYQINFHEIANEDQSIINNCFVIEIVVPKPMKDTMYSTCSGDVFMKTDSGKKKLSIPEIEDEILRRAQIPRKNQTEVLDLEVGIGEDFGYNNEILLGFESFYEDIDITDMFVQIQELFVSKFLGKEYYEKSRTFNRSELFFDSEYIGKTLKWINNRERISLKPNESAYVLFLEDISDDEFLCFGFDAANPNEARKKVWRKDGTYEVYVNVFGKIHNETTYRKRTFVVLVKFIKDSITEIVHSYGIQ